MQHKDTEFRLLITPQLLPHSLNIRLKLPNRIFQRRPCVIHLIHDENPLANQVLHLAQASEIEPLGASDLGAEGLDLAGGRGARFGGEGLVEGEADGLDWDVGRAGRFEEGPEDACRHVASAADGDYELGLEVGEDAGGGFLTELVHLDGVSYSEEFRFRAVAGLGVGNMISRGKSFGPWGRGGGVNGEARAGKHTSL